MQYSIKHIYSAVLMATVTVMLIATSSVALGQGSGMGPRSTMRGPLYDVSTETTVKGTISDVQQLTGRSAAVDSGVNWATCPRGWGRHTPERSD